MCGTGRHTHSRRDQDVLRSNLAAVQVFVNIAVLIHASAIESDACKQSAGASVGIDFGAEKDIGFSLRCPAQWSGRNRGIAAQGKLVLQQLFNSALIYEQQDNVHCFQTNLEPKRSTSDFER